MRFELERAGFGIRAVAGILDWIILILPIGAVIYLITGEISLTWTQGSAWNTLYYIYLMITPVYWNGYIIGKKIVNIKIAKIDGSDLTLSDMFIREFIGIFALGYITLGLTIIISGLMVLLRKDKRALHDHLSGTFVKNVDD